MEPKWNREPATSATTHTPEGCESVRGCERERERKKNKTICQEGWEMEIVVPTLKTTEEKNHVTEFQVHGETDTEAHRTPDIRESAH